MRDRLLGITPKDYDVATNARPDAVCTIFKQNGFKVVPTGVDHGTITVVIDHNPVEITTLRKDVATDGRRAVIAFSDDFAEDAARRDFTMNAMYEDARGKIFDYYNGRLHLLVERKLSFVGDASNRIKEDYLRILRFFRFWAQLELVPDSAALDAIGVHKSGLKLLSQERITHEIRQLLVAKKVGHVLASMQKHGVLLTLFGLDELTAADANKLDDLGGLNEELRWMARLAYILRKKSEQLDATQLMQSLKLSHKEAAGLEAICNIEKFLSQNLSTPAFMMDIIDTLDERLGEGSAQTLLLAITSTFFEHKSVEAKAAAKLADCEHRLGHRRRQQIPVTAKELLANGLAQPGPRLGQLMKSLKHQFRNGEWDTREQGIAKLLEETNG